MRLAFEDTWTGKWLPAGEEISKAAEEKYGESSGGSCFSEARYIHPETLANSILFCVVRHGCSWVL